MDCTLYFFSLSLPFQLGFSCLDGNTVIFFYFSQFDDQVHIFILSNEQLNIDYFTLRPLVLDM